MGLLVLCPRKVDQWRQVVKAAEPTLFITPLDTDEAPEGGNGKPLEEEKIVKRSSWSLTKCEECTDDIQGYRCWWQKALLGSLIDLCEGRNLSRRVINIWAYQRYELHWAS